MAETNDTRFAYDMVSKIFDPLKERIDNHATIVQRLTEKITEITISINNINENIILLSSQTEDFKNWRSRLTILISIGTLIMVVIGGMLVELYFNIKVLNSSIEPLIKIIKP